VWKQIRAILLLPVVVTVVVPGVLLVLTSQGLGEIFPAPWTLVSRLVGLGSIGLGLLLVVRANLLFVRVGRGTLAPWDPTEKLVVCGIYRHVRNPMISGVFLILLGQAVALGSVALLIWFGIFLAANGLYIPLVEERRLEQRFGEGYLAYKRNVPRWIPRWSPGRVEN
jgi:protein-S-isoprenylcysteine O-methyltransferase Ste14